MDLKKLQRGGFSTRQAKALQTQLDGWRYIELRIRSAAAPNYIPGPADVMPATVATTEYGQSVITTVALQANGYFSPYITADAPSDATFGYAWFAVAKVADADGIPVTQVLWTRENNAGGNASLGPALEPGSGGAGFADGSDDSSIKVTAAGLYVATFVVEWS